MGPDIKKQDEFNPCDEAENRQKEIPLCLRCARPVDPLSHYCPHCGETTGQMTPYIPFVNLRMQVNFYVQMWHQICSGRISFLGRIFRLLMIILFVPILLLIALPMMLWEKLKNKKKGSGL